MRICSLILREMIKKTPPWGTNMFWKSPIPLIGSLDWWRQLYIIGRLHSVFSVTSPRTRHASDVWQFNDVYNNLRWLCKMPLPLSACFENYDTFSNWPMIKTLLLPRVPISSVTTCFKNSICECLFGFLMMNDWFFCGVWLSNNFRFKHRLHVCLELGGAVAE